MWRVLEKIVRCQEILAAIGAAAKAGKAWAQGKAAHTHSVGLQVHAAYIAFDSYPEVKPPVWLISQHLVEVGAKDQIDQGHWTAAASMLSSPSFKTAGIQECRSWASALGPANCNTYL